MKPAPDADEIWQRLRKGTRPTKEKTLISYLKAAYRSDTKQALKVMNQLISTKRISISSEKKVDYHLKAA